MRLILLITLLTTFIIARDNGSCVDPDGRQCRGSALTHQGSGTDPDGASVDAGSFIDPAG